MLTQMLKILAAHMMTHHMVAAEGRPTSCGPLVFSAFASACIFCFRPIWYFLPWAHIVLYFPELAIKVPGLGTGQIKNLLLDRLGNRNVEILQRLAKVKNVLPEGLATTKSLK